MSIGVNKAGSDWLHLRKFLKDEIDKAHQAMETPLSPEEYHEQRGVIRLARQVMEAVEPTAPPQTVEDNYGISDPSSENYP